MVSQVLTVIIVIAMLITIIQGKSERHIVALSSGALVIVLVFGLCMRSMNAVIEALNINSIFSLGFWCGELCGTTTGINWSTIIFIAGMMIMVEGMGRAGFFRWLCLKLAKAVRYQIIPLFICFMMAAGILAMLIDSVTAVLFLAAVTVELSRILKFDPVPMVISQIFCANLGSAATMCANPPNLIIGTSLGYTFSDFFSNTGVIVLVCFVFTVIYFRLCFARQLRQSEISTGGDVVYPDPSDAITNKKAFLFSCFVFALAVILLVTNELTNLSVSFIGVLIAILTLVGTLVTSGAQAVKHILKKFDYKTLLFFMGLFVTVSGLEKTGVLKASGRFIGKIGRGNIKAITAIILWFSAILSAFTDNIPFSATMATVIRSITIDAGTNISIIVWALSLGIGLGGNATPIGASANIVGTAVSAREGHPVGWLKYCRYCIPATIMVVFISMICLFVVY